MELQYTGEFAALGVAFCWTICVIAFEIAGKRVGSSSVNLLRLYLAIIYLMLYCWIFRGLALPLDASVHNWVWLSISGIVGFIIGDLALFHSLVLIGSRLSMLIMSSAPPISAILGYFFLHERLSCWDILGMLVTLAGISLVILGRPKSTGKISVKYSLSGIVLAFVGAIGQAGGYVLSKYGMGEYDPFAATQIRIFAASLMMSIYLFRGSFLKNFIRTFNDWRSLFWINLGSFFGPFIGVSLSLLALHYTTTGIASTLMALVPVLVIPPAILMFHESVSLKEIMGAIVAIAGTAVIFLL